MIRGYPSISVSGLRTVLASLITEHRLQARRLQQSQHVGSVVVVHQFSCSEACEIFLDQGSKLCPLHWQTDSYPLYHQGNPLTLILDPLFPHVKELC